MSRRILITNEDGIRADGFRKLAEIAREFGEVTVVAPDTQRSASSHHCVFNRPMTLKAFSVYRRIWKGSKGSDLDAVMNRYISVGMVTNPT